MQQEQRAFDLVPELTTQAGSCLTLANWETAAVRSVSLAIIDLLMKPGLAVLDKLDDIRSYCKWPHKIILNAILPPPDREDVYSFRSQYDGALIRIDARSLSALIGRLNPDVVILPKGHANYLGQFMAMLPEEMTIYCHPEDNVSVTGFQTSQYQVFESGHSFSQFLDKLKDSEVDYLIGNFDFHQLKQLAGYRNYLIETDTPAKDGVTGMVYSEDGAFDILDSSMTNDSRLIAHACQCQTCSQRFTRAYLHHLLQQTPLLAQRYLVQHNVWYCQNHLSSFTSA